MAGASARDVRAAGAVASARSKGGGRCPAVRGVRVLMLLARARDGSTSS